jgi:hypothetical protein
MIDLVRPAGVSVVIYPAIEKSEADKIKITGKVIAQSGDYSQTNRNKVNDSQVGFSEVGPVNKG